MMCEYSEDDVIIEETTEEASEKNKTRSKSYRLKPDTIERLNEVMDAFGGNKDDAFLALLASFELQHSKSLIPDREKEISNFQTHANALVAAYTNSLEICVNAEERIKTNYERALQSKDETIVGLQEKLKTIDSAMSDLKGQVQISNEQRRSAEQVARDAQERASAAEKTADDKSRINEMLSDKLAEAEEKLSGYTELKNREQELKNHVEKQEQAIRDLTRDFDIEKSQAVDEVKQEMNRKIYELQKTLMEHIKNAEIEKQKTLLQAEKEKSEAVQKTIFETENRMQTRIDAMQETKDRMTAEIVDLKSEIRNLEHQLSEQARNFERQIREQNGPAEHHQ